MKPRPGQTVWAFSYQRFSEPRQGDGDSLRRQDDALRAWLGRNPSVRLDTSLTLQDRGVSGFTGKHRLDPRNAMARFTELVEEGRVPPGSYLVVENLDRLTRERPVTAVPWVLGLIAKGIRIVQLAPREQVYDAEMDEWQLMGMLNDLARGHGESKRKSSTVGPAWAAKKAAARNGVPHGEACPAWVELRDGAYRLVPERARVVRLIFRLCADGLGQTEIVRRLTREGVPPFGRAPHWAKSYVAKILSSRHALGEYQPGRGRKSTPEGDPIPGYYPAAVSEAEYYAAQHAMKARQAHSGRPTRTGGPTSELAGLLWSARDGSKLWVQRQDGRSWLVSSARHEGRGRGPAPRFPLDHFLDGVFSQLREVQASALFNDQDGGHVVEIDGRLGDARRRLAVAVERFDRDPESATWADKIDECEAQIRALTAEREEALRRAACPSSAAWTEALAYMRRDNPARLRQALLATVDSVWALFVPSGPYRLAAVQVFFRDSPETRSYLVRSFSPQGDARKRASRGWLALSLAGLVEGAFDLREREQAERLAGLLSGLDGKSLG